MGLQMLITQADTYVRCEVKCLALDLFSFLKSDLCHAEVPRELYEHHQSILVHIIHIRIIQINMNLYKC